jgi:hypothetical protein
MFLGIGQKNKSLALIIVVSVFCLKTGFLKMISTKKAWSTQIDTSMTPKPTVAFELCTTLYKESLKLPAFSYLLFPGFNRVPRQISPKINTYIPSQNVADGRN